MNQLPGNPYAEEASAYIDPRNGAENLSRLAVAHELRTQTLAIIATSTSPDGTYALEAKLVDWAQTQLADRIAFTPPPPPPPTPVKHHRTAPGKCACGFNAYAIRGIMIDYHEELMSHLRSHR